MQTYLLNFTDGSQASCQGQNEYDAKLIAEKLTGRTVSGGPFKDIEAKRLPYPSSPCIWRFDHPVYGATPTFCFRPKECAGRTSCPQRQSCTE